MTNSDIFKYAHATAKNWNTYKMKKKYNNFNLKYSDLFSVALKWAYKKASKPSKNETTQLFAELLKETEKAAYLSIVMANRTEKNIWIPKSLINLDNFQVQTWFLSKNRLHVQRF